MNRFFNDIKYAISWGVLSLMITAVLLSAFLLVKVFDGDNQDYPNTISVTGTGEAISEPDIATFSFSIVESSEDVAGAQQLSTDKSNKVIDFLKKTVDEKDIKTTGYNIYPKYEWIQPQCITEVNCPRGKNELVGYEVNQSFKVKVKDVEKAGELLSGIGSFNVSNVSGLNFEIDNPDALVEQAREEAIKDARSKAKKLAKDLGVDLGDIIGFNEDFGDQPMFRYAEAENFGFGGDQAVSSAPVLPKGENTVTSNVYIIYELD